MSPHDSGVCESVTVFGATFSVTGISMGQETKNCPSHHAERLRIVHYLPVFLLEYGGIVRFVLDLCNLLNDQGHDVRLLTSNAADVPDSWRETDSNSPSVFEIANSKWIDHLILPTRIGEARNVIADADIVHLHSPWYLSTLQLARCARSAQVPYVVSLHGTLDDWPMSQKGLKKHMFLWLAGRRALESAAAIHCTAQGEKNQVLSRMATLADRIHVIPCVVDLSDYEELPGVQPAKQKFSFLNSDRKKVLFLSRMHPKKGIETLIEATSLLVESGMDVELVAAGPEDISAPTNYFASIQDKVAQLNLGEHVHFPGMVGGVDKISLFQSCDVFVLPTHQENFGIVLVEAMASGLPIVTTRGVDIWPELADAGAIITEATPQSLAAAVRTVLHDDSHAQRGQQGRQWVSQWLDKAGIAEGYEAMYRATMDCR